MVLVVGLEGGRWAIASKTHHCMVDGVGSVGVAEVLLDAEPAPDHDADDPDADLALPDVHDDEHGSWVNWMPPVLALRAARAGADVVLHPRKLVETAQRARATAELLLRDELVAAPPASINAPIGAHRSFRVVEVELDAVKAMKRALGGTVNDVVSRPSPAPCATCWSTAARRRPRPGCARWCRWTCGRPRPARRSATRSPRCSSRSRSASAT